MLKVGELEEHLSKRQEGSYTGNLGDFKITDDATELVTDHKTWVLDEVATTALTRYLKVPTPYFNKLTPDFRAQVLRYEFNRHKEVGTTLETLNEEIVAVHQVDQVVLPLKEVSKVVTKVFQPEDTVRRILTDGRFHLDITSANHQLTFPSKADKNVGDITEAGCRIISHPFKMEAPSIGTYVERLTCSNGMCTPETVGRVSLKGKTVPDVISGMEEAANLVLAQLDDYMARLSDTRFLTVPGSPQAFCAQLAKETGVTRQVLDEVLKIVNQLPAPVTVWDVQDAFTEVANKTEKYATMVKLQTLGGHLSFDAMDVIDRCSQCERLL